MKMNQDTFDGLPPTGRSSPAGRIPKYLQLIWGSRYLTFGLRLALGAILIVASISKLTNSAEFVDVVIERDILPSSIAEIYASILPWAEVVIGGLLILGFLRRFAAGTSILIVISFIIANGITLYRGINAECDCFGDVWIMQGRDALIIDILMLIAAIQILFQKTDFLALSKARRKST